jgi:hypothetical protein
MAPYFGPGKKKKKNCYGRGGRDGVGIYGATDKRGSGQLDDPAQSSRSRYVIMMI